MNIVYDLIDKSRYALKCPYKMAAQFIVIHNTSNDASAANEAAYMKQNGSSVSYHFVVDDKEIRQIIPEDRNAWHAGDGTGGAGNRRGIAIEICYSLSGGERFYKAEENAAKLSAHLLKKYGWDMSKVKKHQDFSGKYCPHRTLDMGWDRFLRKVEKNMTNFKDIEGHWAQKHIEKLHKCGIVNGTGEDTFSPDKPVTRAEAAVMIANVLTYLEK